jgi:predicted MFS family arabinose efflux permease
MYYLVHILNLSAKEVGVTIAFTGLGATLGSLIVPKFIARFTEGKIIICCLTLSGLTTFLLLFTANAWQVALVWGIVSASNSVVIVTYFTLRQRVVAQNMLGRTIAITRLISYTAIPIASVFGGWILQNTQNMQIIVTVSGGVLTLSGVLGWLSPLNAAKTIQSSRAEGTVS